jgi:hypothetical protein
MTENTNQQEILSPINAIVAIFVEPTRAMRSVLVRPMAWLPLALVILFSIALFAWYYQIVDFPWLQEKMTATISDPAARAQAQGVLSKNLMMISSVGGIVVVVPLIYAIYALYYFVVAKIKNLQIGYGKWFAFVCWTSMPALLTLPLGAIQIMMAQAGHLDINQLNPVSLNSLFFHLESGRHWASLLDSISLITVWTVVLSVIGFQAWSKMSRAASVLVVLLPTVVIYGAWAGIALMSKAA